MTDLSTKPYLIRAIYEWCADAGFTPYLSVKVDANTRVPMEYVKGGEIVLSISQQATRDLTIGNDVVQFSARFNGVSREVSVPIYAVQGVFARENGRGVFFDPEMPPEAEDSDPNSPTSNVQIAARAPTSRAPTLQAVPQTAALVDQPTDGEQGVKSTDAESPDNTDKPDKPKGPPRGNLRIIK
jgi:stringent starvation protein B